MPLFSPKTEVRMDNLLSVIAKFSLELHPDQISTVATKIKTLESVEQFALTHSSFGSNADKDLVGCNSKDTSPREVVSALRGTSAAAVLQENRNAMKSILPSIDVYVWSSGKKSLPGQLSGAVHAKCAVADGELAFVTGANSTSAMIEHIMELGVLIIKGGNLSFELRWHLEMLISTKVIKKVDGDNNQ